MIVHNLFYPQKYTSRLFSLVGTYIYRNSTHSLSRQRIEITKLPENTSAPRGESNFSLFLSRYSFHTPRSPKTGTRLARIFLGPLAYILIASHARGGKRECLIYPPGARFPTHTRILYVHVQVIKCSGTGFVFFFF